MTIRNTISYITQARYETNEDTKRAFYQIAMTTANALYWQYETHKTRQRKKALACYDHAKSQLEKIAEEKYQRQRAKTLTGGKK